VEERRKLKLRIERDKIQKKEEIEAKKIVYIKCPKV
jgi:hypothetical protein